MYYPVKNVTIVLDPVKTLNRILKRCDRILHVHKIYRRVAIALLCIAIIISLTLTISVSAKSCSTPLQVLSFSTITTGVIAILFSLCLISLQADIVDKALLTINIKDVIKLQNDLKLLENVELESLVQLENIGYLDARLELIRVLLNCEIISSRVYLEGRRWVIAYKELGSNIVEHFPCKIFVSDRPENDEYELEVNIRGVIATNCIPETFITTSFNQEG